MQPIPPSNDENDIQINPHTGNMRIGAGADVNALLRELVRRRSARTPFGGDTDDE